MKEEKRSYIMLLSVSTALGAIGQLLFKLGVTSGMYNLIMFISLGLIAYLVSSVIYFYVLSRTHLSWAYGFGGLSYIFASALAFLFLAEAVPPLRWVGIVVIAIGTALIGFS